MFHPAQTTTVRETSVKFPATVWSMPRMAGFHLKKTIVKKLTHVSLSLALFKGKG